MPRSFSLASISGGDIRHQFVKEIREDKMVGAGDQIKEEGKCQLDLLIRNQNPSTPDSVVPWATSALSPRVQRKSAQALSL